MRQIQSLFQKYNLKNAVVWPFFCFLLMCLNEGEATRYVALVLLVLLIFRLFLGTGLDKISYPLLLLSGYVMWNGIRSLTAISTEFAYQDYTKLLVPFLLHLFLLEEKPKHIAQIILGASGIASFLSMDLLGTRWFSSLFQQAILPFTEQYTVLVGIEPGVRMTSIYSNPNIYAGFTGIAVLLGLALVSNCQHKRQRIYLSLCLFCNALGFLLAVSLGATITLAFGFLLYVLLESKEKKFPLLLLMIELFFCCLMSVFPIYLTSFQTWETVNLYPLLSLVLGALFFCLVHEMLRSSYHGQLAKMVFTPQKYGKLLACLILCFFLALQWKNVAYIDQGENLRRAVYLEGGDYELTLYSTDLMNVSIQSQTQTDILRHTSTSLYEGEGNLLAFQVPEDSVVVFFTFSSLRDVVLEEAVLSNGDEIPLNYVLFPEFITHRLQGLATNQNFWQRFVFFYDGLQLFWMNPLVGLGLGAFNSGLFRVQSFYYETKYAHNHYVQVLLESGMVGFLFFVGAMVCLLLFLWKGRKNNLAPVSLSVLLYTLIHGFMELTWSSGSFLILVYLLLAICLSQCPSLPEKWRVVDYYVSPVLMVFSSLCFVLISFQITADIIVNSSTNEVTFQENLVKAAKLDVFGRSGYMTSYVRAVANTDDPKKMAQAEVFIRSIKAENSNVSAYYIAEYYFKQQKQEKAMDYVEIYVTNGASHPEIWNSAFDLLHLYGWDMEEESFVEANRRIYQIALDWDEKNMGSPVIDEEIRAYVLGLLEGTA